MRILHLITLVALSVGPAFSEVPEGTNMITPKEYSKFENLRVEFTERVYNPAEGENTPWVVGPAKVLSFPLTKLQYEVAQFGTSLLTESVRRSPIHNALGTYEEAKKTLMLLKNGLFDLVRGIFNPKNAAALDGLLGIGSGVLNTANIAGGAVKTVGSVVGYPVYRILGGEASEHHSLPGKRAAIVQVNTGAFPFDYFLDPYGDQIVRHHLNGVVDYYCISSLVEGDGVDDCIDKIPHDVEYVDFVALTHSGGSHSNESAADYAITKGFKPGLMVSIGCYDQDVDMTEYANTMGQEGLSWGVHYYLSSAIAKRLRGIPMNQASQEAFIENLPINFVNPVSILGQIGVGVMGDSIMGSYPRVRNEDDSKAKAIIADKVRVANNFRVMKYAKPFNEGRISVNEFGKLMDAFNVDKSVVLAEMDSLKNNSRSLRRDTEFLELIDNFERTQMPRKVKYRARRLGPVRSVADRWITKTKYVL
ncbi:MAG: hypothetical protein CME64_13170 [Halobacteriovoraceae bacterium]|nr:hypothetical protein [Halobacteriovoraceae bacterium]